jgi:hypothetical protein
MEQKANGFQRIAIGDESWFFPYYFRDLVWAASRDEVPQHIKQRIDMEKCLISILWSVNGIHSLFDVFKGTVYNIAFFTDAIMPNLTEKVRSRTRRRTLKGWSIHMDNARPHSSGRAQGLIEASKAPAALCLRFRPGPG